MSGSSGRTGYAIALVLAVVTLVGSMLAVGLYTVNHRWNTSQAISGQQWRPGPGQGGMMGGRGDVRGPMMGGQRTDLTVSQATRIASDWVAANQPDATVGAGVGMPMGWLFPLTRGGANVGSLMVFGTGQVAYTPNALPAAPPSTESGT